MKAFIDTSTLFKKYVAESGAEKFTKYLEKVSEIIVAPCTWLEIQAVVDRRLREKSITKAQAEWIIQEIKTDFCYFSLVIWNEDLEKKASAVIHNYHLKVMDSLQLAAGCISNPDVFITSDRQLFLTAKRELKAVHYIA